MKTKLCLLIVLIGLAVSAISQNDYGKPFKIGPGFLVGLPQGDMTKAWSLAYGLDLQAEYTVVSSLGLTLSAGYVDWLPKSGYRDGTSGSIPILAGIRYYPSGPVFFSAQLGISFLTVSESGNYFTFAPGIGFKITDSFNLLFKYQAIRVAGLEVDFIGVRAGVSF